MINYSGSFKKDLSCDFSRRIACLEQEIIVHKSGSRKQNGVVKEQADSALAPVFMLNNAQKRL